MVLKNSVELVIIVYLVKYNCVFILFWLLIIVLSFRSFLMILCLLFWVVNINGVKLLFCKKVRSR